MKKNSKILLSFLFLGLLLSCEIKKSKSGLAQKGRLDLKGWDFESKGIVPLDGEWEFYWQRFIKFAEFAKEPESNKRYIDFPGVWNNALISNRSYPAIGYATFRLETEIARPGRRYGLKIQDMNTAYELYINGTLIASDGKIAVSQSEAIPHLLPKVAFFTPEQSTFEIILFISNFHDTNGGSHQSIKLGLEDQILQERENKVSFEIFFLSVIFIMGLYHLNLFNSRRQEFSFLYFGLFCLIISVRAMITGERIFADLFSWLLLLKIEHLTLYLALPIIGLFIQSLFPEEINRLSLKIIIACSALGSLIVIFTPAQIFGQLIIPFELLVIFYSLYIFIVIVRAALKKRELSMLIGLGYFLLYLTVVNDILYDLDLINTGFYVPFGLVLFLFFQSLILSLRFTKAFSRVEILSMELAQKNMEIAEYSKDLEKKVHERTLTIVRQKEDLEEQIRMAQKIQAALLPQSLPNIKGINLTFEYKPMMGIGGDFFDYYIRNKNEIGLFICDVSGHGVSSAFLASMVKMSLGQWQFNLEKPAQTLLHIHESLKGKMGGHFVTAFVLYMNLSTGKLICSSAGHPPQYIIRQNGLVEILQSKGRLIGDWFLPNYSEYTTSLSKGDKLILYTDGIIEVRDSGGILLGDNGFLNLIQANIQNPAQVICQNIIEGLVRYKNNKEVFEDDITLMVMDYQ